MPDDLIARAPAQGIEQPFPVQAATLPDALAGHDLCGRAPTGSGKTLAFGIPLVARVTQGRAAPAHRPRCSCPPASWPSRSSRRSSRWPRPVGLYVLSIYGGAPQRFQAESLRRGASIVVATPGRLTDLIEQRLVDLSAVEVVVIDEADRMADMGFLPQVRKLLDLTPRRPPDAAVVGHARRRRRHARAPLPARPGPPRGRRRARAARPHDPRVPRGRAGRQGRARPPTCCARHGQGIVFCRTRHGADRVARQLDQAGVAPAVVHGSRTQAQRERALEAFRRGDVQALVATDVAARGIHVDDVAVVAALGPGRGRQGLRAPLGPHGPGRWVGRRGVARRPDDRPKARALQRALKLSTGMEALPAPAPLARNRRRPRRTARRAGR